MPTGIESSSDIQLTHESVSLLFQVRIHGHGNFVLPACILYHIEHVVFIWPSICTKYLINWCLTYSSIIVTYVHTPTYNSHLCTHTYIQKTPTLTTCMYFIEYNGTLNLYVHMTTCFSITCYSNITKVPSLLTVNTYMPF